MDERHVHLALFITWGTVKKHARAHSGGSRHSNGLRSPFVDPGARPPPIPRASRSTCTSEGDKEYDRSSSSAERAAGTAASRAWRCERNTTTVAYSTTTVAKDGVVHTSFWSKRCRGFSSDI